MNLDILRRALLRLGFVEGRRRDGTTWTYGGWTYYENDPALPAYVASLLVEQCKRGPHWVDYATALEEHTAPIGGPTRFRMSLADDNARILAALVALGEVGREVK